MKITKKEFIMMLGGMFLMSAAVYYEMMPNNLVLGSLSGLVLVLVKIIPLPVSTITFVLNMILLVIGDIFIGREFGVKTVLASLMLPMYLRIFEILTPHVESLSGNIVIDLVCFMIVVGAGQAVLFNMNASSGGSDIIALILKKYTSVSIGMALLLVDFAVVLISFFVYNPTVGLFSFAGFLAKSFFIDSVIESLNLCKYFTIVSDNADTICDYIHKELNHSATIMSAEGSYSHEPKKVIMTVVNRDQALKLRKFVRSVEPHAFMMITNSSEIIGKGFRNTM